MFRWDKIVIFKSAFSNGKRAFLTAGKKNFYPRLILIVFCSKIDMFIMCDCAGVQAMMDKDW